MTCKKIAPVRLSQIDQEDLTYRISTPRPLKGLIDSIRQIGLINSPILMPVDNSGYRIVSGFCRIAACRQLGWSEVFAHILFPDITPITILGLAIADNAQHRELNLVEQATAVEKLRPYFADNTEMSAYAANLGLTLNHALVDRLHRLNRLSDSIKARIISNVIPLTIALELEKLEPPAAEEFAAFFDELRPTLNQQKEIFLLVKEIARAEDLSVEDVINKSPISEFRLDADMDRPQKLKKIRSYLKKRRYPKIHQFEAFYGESLKSLNLPDGIAFSAPANFEGSRFSMTLSFCSQAEFKVHMKWLSDLADNPSFIRLVNKHFDDSETLY